MLTSAASRPVTPAMTAARVLPAMVAALALVAMMVLGTVPAHAHDTLISSDPADGATLDASPEQITLTYSAEVLEVSPVIQISQEGEGRATTIEPVIDGPTVSGQIPEPLPAGTHTVQWRVVSSDGHPIEGSFTFTVEGGSQQRDDAPADNAPADDAATAQESQQATGEEDTDSPAATTDEQSSSTLPLLLGVIGIAVAGVALGAYFSLRRR